MEGKLKQPKRIQQEPQTEVTEVVEKPITVVDFAFSVGLSENHRFVVEKMYRGQTKTMSEWQSLFETKHVDLLPKI